MKKSRLLVLAAASAALCLVATACGGHEHEYGAWEISKAPTLTESGTATRKCGADGDIQTIDIPALSDTGVWTPSVTKDPSHTEPGNTAYTSEYGTVNVPIRQEDHTYGGWTITKAPTLTETGTAERECTDKDGGKDIATLPVLTDTTVWTKNEEKSVPATHTAAGKDVYVSAYGEAEIEVPAAGHTYGDWTITKAPTLTEPGTAERECTDKDGGKDVATLPVLTDTTVWTKSVEKSEPATHTAPGKDVYVSVYGEAEIVIPATPDHTFTGEWTVTQEPTETAGGKSENTCSVCNEKVEYELPPLTDTDFWHSETQEADYNHAGGTVYTSEYGSFTKVSAPKLVAPYDNKTYVAYELDATQGTNKQIGAHRWDSPTATVTLDANGKGFGQGAVPFREHVSITMADAASGRISYVSKGAIYAEGSDPALDPAGTTRTYAGFVDMASGIIVRAKDASFENVYLITPFGWNGTVSASAWEGGMAIEYTVNGTTHRIFIYEDTVTFGVTFESGKAAGSAAIAAKDVFNAECVYVKKGNEVLMGFVYSGGTLIPSDGKEGVYTGKLTDDGETVTLRVYGQGTLTVTTAQGITSFAHYTIAESGNTLYTYFIDSYYEITLGDNDTFTSVMPMVTVTFNVGEYGTPIQNSTVNKNVPFTLPTPESTGDKVFSGWYTDAACSEGNEVGEDWAPTADVTLYAKWSTRAVVTVVIDDEHSEIKYLGVGDYIVSKLPQFGIEEEKGRYFDYWYIVIDGEEFRLDSESVISEKDTEVTVYAKWQELPAYYGEYGGRQLLSGDNLKFASVVIDEKGRISGTLFIGESNEVTFAGSVRSYDPATQLITWRTSAEDTQIKYFWFDAVSGLLVVPNELTKDTIDQYPFVFSTGEYTVGTNFAFNFHNGAHSATAYTYLVDLGGGEFALVYNNKIYGNVTATDYLGGEIAFESVGEEKTLVVKRGSDSIVAFGTTAEKFDDSFDALEQMARLKALDAYYGAIVVDGREAKLNGLGDIFWTLSDGTEKTGVYTYVKTEGGYDIFDVYVQTAELVDDGSGDGGDGGDWGEGEWGEYSLRAKTVVITKHEYYVLKIAKDASGTHSIEKEMRTVTFSSAHGMVESISINSNIPFKNLPTPADDETHIFRGWYLTEDCIGDALSEITINADTTLYAKWLEKVELTLDLNGKTVDGYETSVIVGMGESVEITAPTHEDFLFAGWYTDAACTDGNEFISGTTIVTGADTLYAKWVVPAYAGTYRGHNTYGASNATGSQDLTIKGGGAITSSVSGINGGQIVSYDPETQLVTWTKNNQTNYFFFDADTGVLVTPLYNSFSNAQIGHDTYTFVLGVSGDGVKSITESYGLACRMSGGEFTNTGSSYYTRFMAVKDPAGGADRLVLIYNDRIYSGITIKNTAGTALTIAGIKNSKTVVAYRNGEIVCALASDKATIGTSGSKFMQLDEYFGTYTGTFNGAEATLTVSGYGELTVGSQSGTYTVHEGVLRAYIGDSYYEITLNGSAYTCVKPMVTVSFNANGGSSVASMEVNKNMPFAIPADPTRAGYVFRGWYLDEACEQPATFTDGKYTPVQSMTFYAKWDAIVTLTVVYGNGTDDEQLEYGASDVTAPIKPLHKNGKVFEKWVIRAEDGTETDYIPGAIYEDTTIYAKYYESASEFTGEYVGVKLDGTTKAGATLKGSRDYKQIVNAEGVTVEYPIGAIEWKDRSSGSVLITKDDGTTHLGYYDETNGLLVYNDYDDRDTLQASLYVLLMNATSVNTSASEIIGCYWNSGLTKLFTLKPSGRAEDEITIFVHGDKAYVNVTFKSSSENETLTVNNAYTAADTLYVYAAGDTAQTNPIATYKRDGSDGLLPLDAYAGTYTADDGKVLTLNGTGKATYDGASGTYTFVELKDGKPVLELKTGSKYYTVTLNGTVYTAVKKVVSVTFLTNVEGVSLGTVELDYSDTAINFPDKAKELLEASDYATLYIYEGTYSDAEFTSKIFWEKPQKYTAVYVKLLTAVTLTLNYGNGIESRVITFKEEDAVDLGNYKPSETYKDGKAFKGWYTDEACTIPATLTVITENTVLYGKWEVEYHYVTEKDTDSTYVYGFKETGGVYASTNKGVNSSKARMSVTAVQAGSVTFQYQISSESNYDKMSVYVGNTAKLSGFSGTSGDGMTSASAPEEGKWLTFTCDLEAGEKLEIRYEKDSSGNKGADTVWIRNVSFTVFDTSSAGTYTGDGEDIVLDGRGGITRGSESGTYEAVADAENTYDVFFEADGVKVSHYTLVIDKEAHTYTIEEEKATVSYEMHGHGAQASVSVFTGIPFTLPAEVTAEGFVFKGWYTNADFAGDPVNEITPTADVVFHAYWVQAFTLTIVFGNGMDNLVIAIAAEEEVNLNSYKPGYTNGMSFEGWYTDAACETAVTDTTFNIVEDRTVYAKWVEGRSFEIEGKTPTGSGKTFSYDATEDAWLTAAEQYGMTYVAIHIYADGTLNFKGKAIDRDRDNDNADSQICYEVYDTNTGTKIKSMTTLTSVAPTASSGSFSSLAWKEGSISVTAGTTVYLIFSRASDSGSDAQAGIKDVSLS